MNNIWEPVYEYEGLYEVSRFGDVIGIDRTVIRKTTLKNGLYVEQELKIKGRILKPDISNQGYYMVSLFKNGKSTRFYVHRLVGVAFVDNPNNLPQINHLDSDRLNNFYQNLEWSTQKQNMQHCVKMGRHKPSYCKGEQCGNSKLTEKQVLEMRSLHYKVSYRNLAKMFGVSDVTVHRILKRRIWKHI